jgi:hypothetical protein
MSVTSDSKQSMNIQTIKTYSYKLWISSVDNNGTQNAVGGTRIPSQEVLCIPAPVPGGPTTIRPRNATVIRTSPLTFLQLLQVVPNYPTQTGLRGLCRRYTSSQIGPSVNFPADLKPDLHASGVFRTQPPNFFIH